MARVKGKTKDQKKEEKGIYDIMLGEPNSLSSENKWGTYRWGPTSGIRIQLQKAVLVPFRDGTAQNGIKITRLGSSKRSCVSHISFPVEEIPRLVEQLNRVYNTHKS